MNTHIAPEIERDVLASILYHPEAAMTEAAERVSPADFAGEANAILFSAMLYLFQAGKAPVMSVVRQRLDDTAMLRRVDDLYLMELDQEGCTLEGFAEKCAIIREKANRRLLLSNLRKAAQSVDDPSVSFQEALSSVEAAAMAAVSRDGSKGPEKAREVTGRVMRNLQMQSEGKLSGLSTGFTDLDKVLSGLFPGRYHVIGGRPGMGKTSLCLDIAAHIAIDQHQPVLFFELEMTNEELVEKILLSRSQVDGHLLKTGKAPRDSMVRFGEQTKRLADAPLFMDDSTGLTPMRLMSKCKRVQSNNGLSLVVVDNIQLMKSDAPTKDKRLEIGGISNRMKEIAKELKVPILVISHLSRSCEQREDKRPVLSDLKETGDIEQDADMVAFIYRDEVYNKDAEAGKAEILIRKFRGGPTGSLNLSWVDRFATFQNYSGRNDEF